MEIRMRTAFWHLAIVAAGIALFARPAQADTITLSGILNASQVVDGGGSTSTATGLATVTIDTTLFTITTDLSWSGLSGPTDRAHLHDAPAGQSRLNPPNGNFFHEVLDNTSVPLSNQVPCGFAGGGFMTDCAPATGTAQNVLPLSAGDGYGVPRLCLPGRCVCARRRLYRCAHTALSVGGESGTPSGGSCPRARLARDVKRRSFGVGPAASPQT